MRGIARFLTGLVAIVAALAGGGMTSGTIYLSEIAGLAVGTWVLSLFAGAAGMPRARALTFLVPIVGVFFALQILARWATIDEPARMPAQQRG